MADKEEFEINAKLPKRVDQDLVERSAQLWCLPEHGNKVMDHDFCTSIARLCQEVRDEACKCHQISDDHFKTIGELENERKLVKETRRVLTDEIHDLKDAVQYEKNKLALERNLVDKLLDALLKYGQHSPDCPIDPFECTCGFTAIRVEYEKAREK